LLPWISSANTNYPELDAPDQMRLKVVKASPACKLPDNQMHNLKQLILVLLMPVILSTSNQKFAARLSESTEKGISKIEFNKSAPGFFWDFDKMNDNEGWMIPEQLRGAIIGGAVWLTIGQEFHKRNLSAWEAQVWGKGNKYDIVSPAGLEIPAENVSKVKMRILNRSPETDGYIFWLAQTSAGPDSGKKRFSMKPDHGEWQEVICHIDNEWKGTLEQIRIRPGQLWSRGDIWIDWISITAGDPEPEITPPDVCSEVVVPKISIPGILQREFQDAFQVLRECLVIDVPLHGFDYPFMAPGGAYGTNWWQLDGSLNVAGAKWVNQTHVENVMRGFAGVQSQNPDGRIDLWGGAPVRGQPANVSSLPRFFEAAYDVARRTADSALQELIYHSMKMYLRYWFSPVKRDEQTGLITAVFEETFGEPHTDPGGVAPVDLNVAVALGCLNTSRLAKNLGHSREATEYYLLFEQLRQSINRFLWNETQGVYYNYNIREGRQIHRLICTTFDPLQSGISPPGRIERVITKLIDPLFFNWGVRPVTSIARTEAEYVEATGPYDGRAWYGDIWTMRNITIIKGLEDSGYHGMAAELIWSTISTFNANYHEYIVPSTGSGEGVQRYGWTASQYIQTVIEHLFGIDYDRFENRLRILPHIPDDLKDKKISISNLIIPAEKDVRLSLYVDQTSGSSVKIGVEITGPLPSGRLEVFLPTEKKKFKQVKNISGEELPVVWQIKPLSNVGGVSLPIKHSEQVSFQY